MASPTNRLPARPSREGPAQRKHTGGKWAGLAQRRVGTFAGQPTARDASTLSTNLGDQGRSWATNEFNRTFNDGVPNFWRASVISAALAMLLIDRLNRAVLAVAN